jgi:NAD(P)-dependent dehydrogenase (short-subunit alcohol dehydrogenase family)
MSKTCLITGGSRGIGYETARLAAADGWDIAITYREDVAAANSVVAMIRTIGRRAMAIRADVGMEADIKAAFAAADAELGPVTGLVNNAGISLHNRVEALADDDLKRMFAVNVFGTMLCCREATVRMSVRHGGNGGSIVNVSSMAATIGGRAGSSTYAATKGAIDVFTTGFAREVADQGIRVNVVRPGVTDTDMIAGMRSGAKRSTIEATIPMGRYGKPQEIAETIVWLLSDKASFVTGAHVNAGGGGFHVGAPSD